MKRSWLLGAAVAACSILAANPSARGQGNLGDSIRTHSEAPMLGNVETVTRNEVVVNQKGVERTLQVDDLERIIFVGEPTKCEARVHSQAAAISPAP